MNKAIEIQDVKKNFRYKERGQNKTVEAVKSISLSVKQGEIFGFLG